MQKHQNDLSLQVHQKVGQRGQIVRRHVRKVTQNRFRKDCVQMLLGQSRAAVKLHHIDRKRPSSFHLSESEGPSQGVRSNGQDH
jgi:hypothetical protein